jgi:rod shape determining protein RodA
VRQSVFAAVGAVGLACATLINPALYRRFWQPLYWLTIGMMIVVFLAAPLTRGSKRWLDLGFFRFQPSEFGKLLFVLALAGFLAERTKRLSEPSTTMAALSLALGPIVLVFLQPDIGTALVYGAALAAVLFLAGTRWLHLAVLGAIVVVTLSLVLSILPAAGVHVLKPYQEARLTGFTNPDSDPSGATYNINQSITAVGAGGVDGRGVSGATQTNLDYLPEHATDFVFASLAEQRGFLGATLLLCLYLLVIWRGLRVVALARDAFSAIVAGGIVVALLFQIFVNVGMTIGIAPITGIPLPFVSVGGSAMIANLVAIGVLLAIHARGRDERPRSTFSAR